MPIFFTDSGKTTLIRQLVSLMGSKQNDDDTFDNDEDNDDQNKKRVFEFVLNGLANIINSMSDLSLESEIFLKIFGKMKGPDMSRQLGLIISNVWSQPEVQEQFRNIYEKSDSNLEHFLDSMSRISSQDYVPTERDIFRLPGGTTGNASRETCSNVRGFRFLMTEVPLAILDRGKWIACFEEATGESLKFNLDPKGVSRDL